MECFGVEPGRHDGRRRQIHWAMAAPPLFTRVALGRERAWSSAEQEPFYSLLLSVTRFGKFHHFCKYLKIFGKIFMVYLDLGKVLTHFGTIGQIFFAVNCQKLKIQSGHPATLAATADGILLNTRQMCVPKSQVGPHTSVWIERIVNCQNRFFQKTF